ncbi:MAG TPA: VanZ family protein [Gemmatimonadales bacterium]|nr:VanZ family protein [Gemmatimonadales bacterium]
MGVTPGGSVRKILPCLAAALFIGYFTLLPGGTGAAGFRPGGYLLTDLILNVILFIPLGLALGFAGAGPRRAALIGLIGSAAIELAQHSVIPGRYASLHDVITNATGAWLGAVIMAQWEQRTRLWRVAGPAAAVIIIAAWVGGGLLLSPSFPPPWEWYAQWAHDFGDHDALAGQVQGVTLQGIPLPDGPVGGTRALREALVRSDTVRLEIVLTSGAPPFRSAQVASVVAERNEMIGVWQEGDALFARQQLRVTDAGLRTPWIRLDRAMPQAAGDTVRISYEVSSRSMRLRTRDNADTRDTELRLSPRLFWSAFLPFDWQGGTGSPWWPLLPAILSYVVLGMALGRRPAALLAAVAITLFGGPLLGAGAFPDAAGVAIAVLGPLAGLSLGRKLSL